MSVPIRSGDSEAMSRPPVRYLTDAELKALPIRPPEIADALEHLLIADAGGLANTCPKAAIHPVGGRLFMVTLAQSDDPPYAVTKTVGLSGDNKDKGLPLIGSVINLLDAATGMPVAVMDGAWITATRTAAMSVVAARKLARADAETVLFVGCGVQGYAHLAALAAEFPLRRILANSRTETSAQAFCEAARGDGYAADVIPDLRDGLPDADIIVTSVPHLEDAQPFLDASDLKAGGFIASVDVGRSWIEPGFHALDRLVIDDRAQEALIGPCVDLDQVDGDLGELVNGAVPARTGDAQRCAYVSRGLGYADLALAVLAYERAREAGAGIELPH